MAATEENFEQFEEDDAADAALALCSAGQMTHKAMEIGRTGRVQVEDIVFLVRKDPRKYARVKDLLTMNEELKRARKAFDEIKFAGNVK
ncbi:hypothetical protein NQ317_000443 [Molorchus minor]|uniref:Transcription initiation factor TFIID subunit 13 n=1 Tax=Molorchus minor TaxID=1323400 RepID=A0ABQ9J685_9CUCU|nr:hypothetical protein NQ317_000443 [Molorchus minor]